MASDRRGTKSDGEPPAGGAGDDRPVYIFADESCLGNQFRGTANPGGAAGMLEQFRPVEGWYRKDYYRHEPDTTNNRMALWSGIVGLGALNRPCDVVFVSDSQYLVKGMKEWIHGWAERGWRRKGGRVGNLPLWKRLARAAGRHRVEWRWIRGHADHPKNEYAHDLATGAAERGESSPGLVPSGFHEWVQGHIDRGRFVEFLDMPPQEDFRPDPAPPTP